jgi:uncharacterized protein (TIGR02145 family)
LTDIRDGKQYPTFSLSDGKCWMSANLAYGSVISSAWPQEDNCLAERYITGTGTTEQSFYQWNELMQYTPAEGTKGLCPPGWHIPTATEWLAIINLMEGPGQAGGPLKDPWLSNGFHAKQPGLFYQNKSWSFYAGEYAGSMYWTSTNAGIDRAVARGLNLYQNSVSYYESLKNNAFNVRCCK